MTLTFINQFAYKINLRVGKKIQSAIVSVIFFSLTVLFILDPFFHFSKLGYYAFFSILAAAFFSVSSVSEGPRKVFLRKSLIFPVVIIGIFYLISAFLFKDNNRISIAMCFIALIPLESILLSENSSKRVYVLGFVKGNMLALPFLIMVSAIFAPIGDMQYSSIMLNPNGLSAVTTVIYVCTLAFIWHYWLFESKKIRILLAIFSLVCLAQSLLLIILSRSRTGLLSITLATAFFVLFAFANNKLGLKKLIKRFFVILISCVIILMLTLTTFPIINNLSFMVEEKMFGKVYFFTTLEFSSLKVEHNDFILSEGNGGLDTDTVAEGLFKRVSKGMHGEDVSSGRFAIWESAIKALNIKGHSENELFYSEHSKKYLNDTHNIILEISYETGILGGLAAVTFMGAYLISMIKLLKKYLSEKEIDVYGIFIVTFGVPFGVIAMLSNVFVPVSTMIALGFWTTLPIAEVKKNEFHGNQKKY